MKFSNSEESIWSITHKRINICLGNYLEEAESIVLFCKEYGFDRFFDAFPQGLNTLLGEDGVHISGGQQQLIALARAHCTAVRNSCY